MLPMVAVMSALAAGPTPTQAIQEAAWARHRAPLLAEHGPHTVESVTALGQLRRADLVDTIAGIGDTDDPALRVAAIDALANTPDSAPVLRTWLAQTKPARGKAAKERNPHLALLAALGRQGEEADVPALVAALDLRAPAGPAAAIALGRMGRRKVDASAAVPDLLAALGSRQPETVEAAAFALFRIGLPEGSLPDEVLEGFTDAPTPSARAWLVRAGWPGLGMRRGADVLERLLADPERLVRVAVLDALRPGDADPPQILAGLEDDDGWVRAATAAALGRLGHGEPLPEAGNPWELAPVVAQSRPVAGEPAIIGATRVAAWEDPHTLAAAAVQNPEPLIRTAAAGALLGFEPSASIGRQLLAADDPVIREVGVEVCAGAGNVDAVTAHLAHEEHPEVIRAAAVALAEAAVAADGLPPGARDRLAPLLGGADPVARMAAEEVLGRVDGVAPLAGPFRTDADRDVTAIARIRSATVETSRGSFEIRFEAGVAPLAVANFARLADDDYFDGLRWHRLVPGFVAQTGCPRGDGWGGPGWLIPDETSALPYVTGAVGMARAAHDTGGSQWFVTLSPQPHLDGDYTLFGHVVDGMDVVSRLERGDTIVDVQVQRAGS